ncbi:hypothetical protein Lalb_Chr15g0082571 [Lupinus albus]|uniref:Uncharacterized protein n=1 Tax=Lupinus albus TaxID=3870 RepID=A0A6A4NYC6_LUPAL|nr:hypothetical protein Lalb_Chr15g0082571 [Lupinus albus]
MLTHGIVIYQIGKSSKTSSSYHTGFDPSYKTLIARMETTLFFYRIFHNTSLDTLSYAFSKSMETMCKSFWFLGFSPSTKVASTWPPWSTSSV